MQLTPAPEAFIKDGKVDGRDLMQQLIQAWTTVDRKDRYEFKLRVIKRKEATAGAQISTSAATAEPKASQSGQAGAAQP